MPLVKNDWPRFIRELVDGNPVYIYMMDGEYVHAVKIVNWSMGDAAHQNAGFIDVEDDEGDWVSINLALVTNAISVK